MTADPDKRHSLSRRGVVRANGGPLREVKVELGLVVLLVVAVWLITVGWDGPPGLELAIVATTSILGALWIVWRSRRAYRRWRAEERS